MTLCLLARYLGLPPASVSLVPNQAPGAAAIPKAVQDRIRVAAERFHDRPNILVRRMAMDERRTGELQGDAPLPESGHRVTRTLLAEAPGVTALLAFNDLSAFGAIAALETAGLRVPRDVSVFGFEDIQGASSQNPPLTTIRQSLTEMGTLAAETAVQRITTGAVTPRLPTAPPELVIRGSTAAVAGGESGP